MVTPTFIIEPNNNNYGSSVAAPVVSVVGTICASEAVPFSDTPSCEVGCVDRSEEDSSVCFGVSLADGSDSAFSAAVG